MTLLQRQQFNKIILDDRLVWKSISTVGSTSGESKTSGSGWKAVGRNPMKLCVWNGSYENSAVNFHRIIDDYIQVRDKVAENDIGRFLLLWTFGKQLFKTILKDRYLSRIVFQVLSRRVVLLRNFWAQVQRVG